jgi:hypothetical protein
MSSESRHLHWESRNKLSPKGRVPSRNNFQNMFRNLGLGLSEPRDKERSKRSPRPAWLSFILLLNTVFLPCSPRKLLPACSHVLSFSVSSINCSGVRVLPSPHHVKAEPCTVSSTALTSCASLERVLSSCQTLMSSLFTI